MGERILVCGSRYFNNFDLMDKTLRPLWVLGETILIHGCALGADNLSEDWVVQTYFEDRVNVLRFPPNWGRYGRGAGPIRNQLMLDEGKPTHVVAFPLPQSKGTWDMIRRAKKAGVKVTVVGG